MALRAAQTEIAEPEAFGLEQLKDPVMRKRLSAPAVALFLKTADLLDLKVEARMALLGGISRQTYHNWKAGKVASLTRDQLERISLVLGVLKGLRLVFAEDQQGERWLKAANSDLGFGGRAPLEVMTDDGLSGLHRVRRYLDAWRGVK